MGEKFLIDTNTLIDAQMQKLPEKGLQFLAEIINKEFTISFITYIEFLGYKYATEATKEFVALANVIEINQAVIDICIDLRKTQNIKLPDTIIAATAIAYNLILVTNNEKDFTNIERLVVINLYKI